MAPRSPAGSPRRGNAVGVLARTTGLTNKLTNEFPVARAYACDAGDPAGGMGAPRSVIASLFAAAA